MLVDLFSLLGCTAQPLQDSPFRHAQREAEGRQLHFAQQQFEHEDVGKHPLGKTVSANEGFRDLSTVLGQLDLATIHLHVTIHDETLDALRDGGSSEAEPFPDAGLENALTFLTE